VVSSLIVPTPSQQLPFDRLIKSEKRLSLGARSSKPYSSSKVSHFVMIYQYFLTNTLFSLFLLSRT
jgi:hypothetical protein